MWVSLLSSVLSGRGKSMPQAYVGWQRAQLHLFRRLPPSLGCFRQTWKSLITIFLSIEKEMGAPETPSTTERLLRYWTFAISACRKMFLRNLKVFRKIIFYGDDYIICYGRFYSTIGYLQRCEDYGLKEITKIIASFNKRRKLRLWTTV